MYLLARTTPNRVIANMWKDLIEAGGVPSLMFADRRESHLGESGRFVVLVPHGKDHVVEESLRSSH